MGKRRRTNPALYELIQTRQGSRAAPVTPDPAPTVAAPTTGESIGWFSPGRTIRLPVGYLFLGAAGLILLAVSAYMFGYQHGERATELQFGDLADRTNGFPSAQIAQDPMATDSRAGAGSPRPATYGPAGRRLGTGSVVTNAGRWGPAESDPREAGLNYFILIHTQRENAIELANFCRKESLEAYVVKAKNMDQYQVIVLPGYRKGARELEQIRTLERRIKQVTRKWKLRINPRDDLSYYPDRYDG
ncbi:MAG: hypothetical protein V3T53_03665 [Phycisphaerales bacterium]